MGTAIADWLLEWQVNKHSQLGAGTFGTVYAGIDKNMQAVAIKIQRFTQTEDAAEFSKEVASLELLRCHPHPNIIRLYDFVLDMTDMASGIAMELATMDLRRLLNISGHKLMPETARSFSKQLVAGIAHIHQLNMIQRDIKPQSLLMCITAKGATLKLGDFGSSKQAAPRAGMTCNMVTCWYRAPEVFSHCPQARIKYGKPVDVWSMVWVLWELCIGSIAFGGSTDAMVCAMITHRLGLPVSWPKGFPEKALLPCVPQDTSTLAAAHTDTGREELEDGVNLVGLCLKWLPGKRISAAQCQKHMFCAGHGPSIGLVPALSEEARSSAHSSSIGPSSAQRPTRIQAASKSSRDSSLALNIGQPDSTLQCQCVGNCRGGHRNGTPCLRDMPSNLPLSVCAAICNSCRCSSPDCSEAKFRSPFCFKHAYQGLRIEFRVIRHLWNADVIQQMMPQELQAFLEVKPKLGKDLALELIAAWVNNPAAIKLLAAHQPQITNYKGKDLLISLQQVFGP